MHGKQQVYGRPHMRRIPKIELVPNSHKGFKKLDKYLKDLKSLSKMFHLFKTPINYVFCIYYLQSMFIFSIWEGVENVITKNNTNNKNNNSTLK